MASNEMPSSSSSSSVRLTTEDVGSDYEIKNLLGERATSKVYLGEHKRTRKSVAIKCISSEHQRCLKNEVDALRKLKHRNIIPLIEVFQNRTEVYLVMELATGGELFDRILERVQFTEKDASSVIYQILDAVANIHDAGIVHRDLKLDNILYETPGDDSKIMLTDFGLSGIDVVGKTLTKKVGTSSYMAPEIVKKKAYGKEVDVWAIGVITFILLCGYPPFYEEHNRDDVVKQIKKAKFDFASPYWNDISDAAKCFVTKLLDKDPKKRYTCRQAMQDPWICGGAAGTKNIQESVSNNMKKFVRNKCKQTFNVSTAAVSRLCEMVLGTSTKSP